MICNFGREILPQPFDVIVSIIFLNSETRNSLN